MLIIPDTSIPDRNAIEASRVGLSRSGSRFSKMFPRIFPEKLLKSRSKKQKLFLVWCLNMQIVQQT